MTSLKISVVLIFIIVLSTLLSPHKVENFKIDDDYKEYLKKKCSRKYYESLIDEDNKFTKLINDPYAFKVIDYDALIIKDSTIKDNNYIIKVDANLSKLSPQSLNDLYFTGSCTSFKVYHNNNDVSDLIISKHKDEDKSIKVSAQTIIDDIKEKYNDTNNIHVLLESVFDKNAFNEEYNYLANTYIDLLADKVKGDNFYSTCALYTEDLYKLYVASVIQNERSCFPDYTGKLGGNYTPKSNRVFKLIIQISIVALILIVILLFLKKKNII